METSPPIHLLPIELLTKIIEKLPRTQWPALELIDRKFRDAALLAWGSIREVDIERDFIYSETAIEVENNHDSEMIKGRLRHQITRKTEAILKKLSERSPFVTSLCGLSFIYEWGEPILNTTAIRYLTEFEHLETIKFATKYFSGRVVNGSEIRFMSGIPFINFIEFIESTQSRASLKEIVIEQSIIPHIRINPNVAADFDRLRAAFACVPTRQLLQLESFSMVMLGESAPLTFFDTIDTSRMTKLSLGRSPVEPTALMCLINGASRLQHIDFEFLKSCRNTTGCRGGRLQPNKDLLAALESHPNLTSLGFNSIWSRYGCACHRFETEFMKMLLTIGPQLVNFSFKPHVLPPEIPMGQIRDIIHHHMPQLKSITLDRCCAENPEDLRGIADGKELEEIVFASYTTNDDNHTQILNEVMSTIISESPRLQRFSGDGYCPDQRVIVELCKLSDLVDLRIRADRLTSENFVAFSHQVFAEKLEILDLGQIGEGVEPGLIEVVGKATQLRELRVDRNVTDRLLECLAESCPHLQKFTALSPNGITLKGVQMLVDRCPMLRQLYVSKNFTSASFLKDLKLDQYRKLELKFKY